MYRRILTSVILGYAAVVGRPVSAGYVSGALYATAENLNQVIQINSDGSTSTALNVMNLPMGLAFRNSNELYVTGVGSFPVGNLIDYRSDGSVVFTATSVPVTNLYPNGSWGTGLAIDSQGNAFISTWNSPGATKITANGVISDWTGYQYGLWWGRGAALAPNGQLYTIQDLDSGPNPVSTLATINTVTGAVHYVLQSVPFLNGIAIDSQGNIYLSEYAQNEIVKIAAGTGTITPFASLADAGPLAIGPDGRLYAVGATQTGTDQIWSYSLSTGGASLYASNLPYLTDIAFAPWPNAPPYNGPPIAVEGEGGGAVPEPSTFVMALIAVVSISGYARPSFAKSYALNSAGSRRLRTVSVVHGIGLTES